MTHLGAIIFSKTLCVSETVPILFRRSTYYQNMVSFQIFHDKKCSHRTVTSNSYRAKVELARNTEDSNFKVSFMVEDQQDFENVIPENVAEKGKRIKQYALHYLSTVCPHYEFNIDTIIKLNQAAAIF